jgi:hypothetical protein
MRPKFKLRQGFKKPECHTHKWVPDNVEVMGGKVISPFPTHNNTIALMGEPKNTDQDKSFSKLCI